MSKRQHNESTANGPSLAQLSKRVSELSAAQLRELVLAAACDSVDFALQVMEEKQAARMNKDQLDAKKQDFCNEAERVWHSLDRVKPSLQYTMAGQIVEQFERNILQPASELAPDDELHILTVLADATANCEDFEGEIWKNAIGGCGGGIIGTLAQRMEEIFERCDSKDVAACKANWEDIARRLEDYGMDEFDELIDLAGGKSAPTFGKRSGKGHYAVYSGFGKGSGGHSGGRGRSGR